MRTRYLLIVLLFLAATRAEAYIEALMPLSSIFEESTHVMVGHIESVDFQKRSAVARIESSLKGAREYERVQMNLGAGLRTQGMFLLELLESGDPFILYYERHGGSIKSLAHAGDYWFQLFANHQNDDRRVWWRFTHIEKYLPRTYNGTTPDLIELTRDVLKGRKRAPGPKPRTPIIDVRKLDAKAARRRKRGVGASKDGAAGTVAILIPKQSEWSYRKGKAAPSSGKRWLDAKFDDSSWSTGRAPLGYGDPPLGTELGDMQKKGKGSGYTTLYLRRRFVVPKGAAVRKASCRVNYDDGFILWIDGQRAASSNAPGGTPTHASLASVNHESGSFETFTLGAVARTLSPGEHVAAVQVFNILTTSSDLKCDLELEVVLEKRGASGSTATSGRFVSIARLKAPGGGEVRGVSWVDVNSDEMLDLHFCRTKGDLVLINEGKGFSNGTKSIGLTGGSRSAVWADWNGDDYPDLLTNNFQLFTNHAGRLTDSSHLLKPPSKRNAEGAGWIDYNGDGRPDVLVTNGESGLVLWENTGVKNKPFRDVSKKTGLGPGGIGSGNGDFIALADFDGEGYSGFFYNLGKGVLARNDGEGMFSANDKSGIELHGGSAQKRGVAIADFDRDGDLDLLVPGPGKPALYRNENDGSFKNVVAASGDLDRVSTTSFSAAWGDVDNDGHLDLFIVFAAGNCRLYVGNGKGKFRDATKKFGLDKIKYAAAGSFADYDADGDLDLAINQKDSVSVYRNELEKKSGTSGLEVRLAVRRGRVGSTVRVLDQRGNLLGLRQPFRAEGCGGQAAPISHIAVPHGACRVSVILGDGRYAEKTVVARKTRTQLTFRDNEFK